jgi:hypothetical protein
MNRCADQDFLSHCAQQLHRLIWVLKGIYALFLGLAGIDKLFYKLLPWQIYISPLVSTFLPINLLHVLKIVGAIEIALAILILSRFTRLAAWLLIIFIIILVASLGSKAVFSLKALQLLLGDMENLTIPSLLLIALGAWVITRLVALCTSIESYKARLAYDERGEI